MLHSRDRQNVLFPSYNLLDMNIFFAIIGCIVYHKRLPGKSSHLCYGSGHGENAFIVRCQERLMTS